MFSKVRLDAERTKRVYGYDPETLPQGSHQKVVVECLGCHRTIHREYRNLGGFHQCPVFDGTNKKCFKCEKWLDISCFNKNPQGTGGVGKMCRQCYNSHPSVIRSEKWRAEKRRQALEKGDIESYIKFRVDCIRTISKRKGVNFDLDSQYMLDLWKKQNGLCHYTRMPMKRIMKQMGFQAWDSPSVDRKDPEKGYVKGNVVWCTFAANSFKQSLTEIQFRDAVKTIRWWFNE